MDTNETKFFEELAKVEKGLLFELDTTYTEATNKIDAYLAELKNKKNERTNT